MHQHHPPGALSQTHLRVSLAVHAGVFIVVNAILVAVDLSTPEGLWFFWPLLGWGIGLAYHAWAVFRRLRGRQAGDAETAPAPREEHGGVSGVSNSGRPT